ncbi:MAG: hypothetical protein K5785_00790 [Nitrosarchaeum sp.]|nr:hypothetical protein [Nitrosarchaeum sp.]
MVRAVLPLSVTKEIEDLIIEAQAKALKEGKKFNLSGLLREPIKQALKRYIIEHGDGNPGFDLEQWIRNENFQATPALFRNKEDVQNFINGIKNTSQFQEVGKQLQMWVDIFNEVDSL